MLLYGRHGRGESLPLPNPESEGPFSISHAVSYLALTKEFHYGIRVVIG